MSDRKLIAAQVEWGAHWLACADAVAWFSPDHARACQHNAHMLAMNVLALEALA